MPLLNVDENFAQTFGIDLIAGNFFHDKQGIYVANRVVLNEQAVRNFGWTAESAIGRQITYDGNVQPLTIVGVVRNFHFSSLFQSMSPISMMHINDGFSYRYLSLQINPEEKAATVERLKLKWASLFPAAPFDYAFMEDKVNQFYAVEDRIYKSSKVASVITVLLTMSGMVAFMSISLARRVKEIGIRKVHGATSGNLILLLIKDFFWEFIVGGIFASVFAYYFLTNWLNSFTYNVGLSFYTFAFVLLAILMVLSVFVATYSLNVIRTNPVKSLRYE
jgi:putative ABC transport system permease protein